MLLPQITFVGSGNLAWHLAPALDSMGCVVKEVCSATLSHAKLLSRRLYHAAVQTSLDFSSSSATVFIIAVVDDAVQSVARDIILPKGATLLHTSGSLPIDVLECSSTSHIGVFYPLQTFSKVRKINFKGLPIFFEGKTEKAESEMMCMANTLRAKLRKANSLERKTVHVAAVFASNFVNHMLSISHDLLQKHNFNPALLTPLIAEVIDKELSIGPYNAQTGPAMRGDRKIVEDHLRFLDSDPPVAEIYKHISRHIMSKHAGV